MFAFLPRRRRPARARQTANRAAGKPRREFRLEMLENRLLLAGPDGAVPLDAADQGGLISDLYVNRATVLAPISAVSNDAAEMQDNSTTQWVLSDLAISGVRAIATWQGADAASGSPSLFSVTSVNDAEQPTLIDTVGNAGVTFNFVTDNPAVSSDGANFEANFKPLNSAVNRTVEAQIVGVATDDNLQVVNPAGDSQRGDFASKIQPEEADGVPQVLVQIHQTESRNSNSGLSPASQPGRSFTLVVSENAIFGTGRDGDAAADKSLQPNAGINLPSNVDDVSNGIGDVISPDVDVFVLRDVDGDAILNGDAAPFGVRVIARADAMQGHVELFENDTVASNPPAADDNFVDNAGLLHIEAAVERPRFLATGDITERESSAPTAEGPSEAHGLIDVALVLNQPSYQRLPTARAASLIASTAAGDDSSGPITLTLPLNGTRGRSQAFEVALTEPRAAGILGAHQPHQPATFDLAAKNRQIADDVAAADLVFERIGDEDDPAFCYVYTKHATPLMVALVTTAGLVLVRPNWGVPDGRDQLTPRSKSSRRTRV